MLLKLPVLYNQRDAQWASALLGYNAPTSLDAMKHPYNIGWYGCLISCLGMQINKRPDEVNKLLKDNAGFQSGSGNFIWGKSIVLNLAQLYVSPKWSGPVTQAGLDNARSYLEKGNVLLCEVDFNPATPGEEMHYVNCIGYEGNTFMIADPWTGTIKSFDTYGGFSRAVVQYRVYDVKFPLDVGPIDPQAELDKVRAERDKNWNMFVSLCDIMGIGASYDLAVNELKKLVASEDILVKKDGELTSANTKLSDLQQTLNALMTTQESLKSENDALTQQVTDQGKTITEQTGRIQSLSEALEELKKALGIADLGAWRLFKEAFRRLFGFK